MNPLGTLPPATSAGNSLNAIDWMKLLRMLLVLLAGWFLTYVAPVLVPVISTADISVWGFNIQPLIMGAWSLALEALRRWKVNHEQ
jgi:hypothetical protein